MNQLTISVPPELQSLIDTRLSEGVYVDAGDYVRDLMRRDQRTMDADRAWLRARIEEGLASGVIDRDAEDVLDEIIAEDPDLRG